MGGTDTFSTGYMGAINEKFNKLDVDLANQAAAAEAALAAGDAKAYAAINANMAKVHQEGMDQINKDLATLRSQELTSRGQEYTMERAAVDDARQMAQLSLNTMDLSSLDDTGKMGIVQNLVKGGYSLDAAVNLIKGETYKQQNYTLAQQKEARMTEQGWARIDLALASLAERTNSDKEVFPGQVVTKAQERPVKLTDAQSQFISMGNRLSDVTSEISTLLEKTNTSALKGWVTEQGMTIPVIQGKLSPDQQNLMQKMYELNNMYVYFSTGKQLNQTEFDRLSKQTPNFRATPEYNKSAVTNFKNSIDQRMNQYLDVNGWKIYGRVGKTEAPTTTAPKQGDTKQYNGATYMFNGTSWVKQK
jgi:hypothetical protein